MVLAIFGVILLRNIRWMGEKYDGVRCCWNPKEQSWYTRSGLALEAFQDIVHCFPKTYLDGEVWYALVTIESILSILGLVMVYSRRHSS